MERDRWQRIDEIFQELLDSGESERDEILTARCGADAALRAEVESLLMCDGKGGSRLLSVVQREAEHLSEASSRSEIGRRVGAYRLTGILGRGGMGTVYLAERDDDAFRKTAAVKLIKRGMDTDEILSRFRRERQILARLEHPHIARLLDAGSTADGLPYIVMEYVPGETVTGFCLKRGLSIESRVRLFLDICGAVQYAHQNLVIHRDLKPGNILVTPEGVPKLLDFGIAKLLDDDRGQTMTAIRVLTPEYSSPEQILGLSITTATDVYSLGAVLYEILTGRSPHQHVGRSTGELERAITESEPPRPRSLNSHLAGDLENILAMALRKEPHRRYSSAAQMSEDLQRYLEGRPVAARPDTMLYRTGRFIRRNRLAFALGVFAWVALAAGAGIAWREAQRAKRGFRDAQQYASAVLVGAFEKFRQLPGTLEARANLAQVSLEYLNKLALQAGSDRDVKFDLATGYIRVAMDQASTGQANLQEYEKARDTTRRAHVIAQELYQADPNRAEYATLLAVTTQVTALILDGLGQGREALEHFRRAEQYFPKTTPAAFQRIGYPNITIHLSFYSIQRQVIDQGDYRAVLAALRGREFNTPFSVLIKILEAEALAGMGDVVGAHALLSAAPPAPPIQPYVSHTINMSRLALLASWEGNSQQLNLGRPNDAIEHIETARAMGESLLAKEPKDAYAAWRLAVVCYRQGGIFREVDPRRSLEAYERSLALYDQVLARSPSSLRFQRERSAVRRAIALPLRKLARTEEARRHLEGVLEWERQTGSPAAMTRIELADLDVTEGRRQDALAGYRAAIQLAEPAIEQRPQDMQLRSELADAHERLAAFLESTQQRADACSEYSRALRIWRDWSRYGVSNPYNQRREKSLQDAMKRCSDR